MASAGRGTCAVRAASVAASGAGGDRRRRDRTAAHSRGGHLLPNSRAPPNSCTIAS